MWGNKFLLVPPLLVGRIIRKSVKKMGKFSKKT